MWRCESALCCENLPELNDKFRLITDNNLEKISLKKYQLPPPLVIKPYLYTILSPPFYNLLDSPSLREASKIHCIPLKKNGRSQTMSS